MYARGHHEGKVRLRDWQRGGPAHGVEREVADLLPMETDPADARAVLDAVPFWFHTFALNRAAGLYTPGVARDHRYVYWGFSGHGLEYLAALAGYERAEVVDTPVVDGHPRILATLSTAPGAPAGV